MATDKLLKEIGNLFTLNTALLRKEIKESEERVKKEILKSQEETIETLTELMNEGYNQHEKRIKAIENHLQLPQ